MTQNAADEAIAFSFSMPLAISVNSSKTRASVSEPPGVSEPLPGGPAPAASGEIRG